MLRLSFFLVVCLIFLDKLEVRILVIFSSLLQFLVFQCYELFFIVYMVFMLLS